MNTAVRNQQTTRTLSIPDFIDSVKREITSISESAPLLSFSCIMTCIEMLGGLLDNSPVETQGLSKIRFDRAIHDLFPRKYLQHTSRLYNRVRCPLVHRVQPDGALLSHAGMEDQHLSMDEYGILIVALRPLMEDFLAACDGLTKKIRAQELNKAGGIYSYWKIKESYGFDSKKEPTILLRSATGS